MNNRSHRWHKQDSAALAEPTEQTEVALLDEVPFPAPDPSTRVAFGRMSSSLVVRPHGGELVVAAGLGAILISVCSKFVQLIDLPSLSEVSVAALGGLLAMLGMVKHRHGVARSSEPAGVDASASTEVDLPSLTGQLSAVLAQLRFQHGVVYRTRTWIEVVLPAAGFDVKNPTLTRDLLAAAALDAGGVRADVARLAESYSREEITATSRSLIKAVRNVLAICEHPSETRAAHPSDPSCWPASAC